jgi:hypothetical protein
MPWIPELFSEPVLEEWRERHERQKIVDVPYYDGLLAGEPDALIGAFSGEPLVFHPVRGRVRGEWQLRAYASETRGWFRARDGRAQELLHVVGPERGFEEVLVTSPAGVLPMAFVIDHADGTHLDEIRIYFSVHHFLGYPTTRQPLLQADPSIELPPVIAEYFRALADADLDAASAAYAKGATIRTADGVVEHDVHAFHTFVCRDGGLVLETCTRAGDDRHVALEANLLRLGEAASAPPRAGMIVFDLEPGGARITAARIYDDVALPRLSQP